MEIELSQTAQRVMQSVEAGEIPARAGWQLTLREGIEGWPADVRELVTLGGEVLVAGNRWIIVTEELRDDILFTASDKVAAPDAVTVIMLDDLPRDLTFDPGAMDDLHRSGWMTATGDAFVLPVHPKDTT